MRILYTCFEPFGGASANASEQVAELVADQYRDEKQVFLETHRLECVYTAAAEQLKNLLRSSTYDIVIATGQASGRAHVCLEKVAINYQKSTLPDNKGVRRDQPCVIVPDGASYFFSSLATTALVTYLRGLGCPVRLSYCAGLYVCNTLAYTLASELAAAGTMIPAGFVHVPASEQSRLRAEDITLAPELSAAVVVALIEYFRSINGTYPPGR